YCGASIICTPSIIGVALSLPRNSAGDLYCMHLPWQSEQLTEFAHKFDNATVEHCGAYIGEGVAAGLSSCCR
ncbi:hypothetical protein VP01_10550g1, partial [Puccinia sorghi]